MDHSSVTLLSDGQIKALFQGPKPDRDFILSTVTVGDELRLKWTGDVSLNALVQRCVQWIAICARTNAKFCAGQTVRLLRKARGGKKAGPGFKRVTDRRRLKYLRSALVGKAAGYALDADDLEEITEHPLLDLLRRPNAFTTGHALALARFMDLEIAGNAFIYAPGGDSPPALYRLAPHKTAVIPSRETFIAGYRYGAAQDIKRDLPVEDVDHYRFMPSLVSPYLGASWVQDVIMDADRYAASTEADLANWKKGGRPDWVFKLPPGSNPESVKQAREEVKRRFQGPSKTGEVLFTTADEIIPLQWKPKDLEGVASREDAKRIILNAAGVPETMFSMQDANRAGALAGLAQYARVSIAPRLAQDAAEMSEYLLPRFGLLPGDYWFCYDNPVPEDEAAETAAHVSLALAGLMTLNQSLTERGYEAAGPEGDVYRVNGVAVGTLDTLRVAGVGGEGTTMEPKPDDKPAERPVVAATPDVQATALNGAQVTALQALLQSVADGQMPTETARAAIAASYPTLTPEQVGAMIAPLEGFEPTRPEPPPEPGPAAEPKPPPESKTAKADHRLPGESVSACVARKLDILLAEGRDHEQALAIAYSMCGGKLVHPAYAAVHNSHVHTKDASLLSADETRAIAEIERLMRQWFNGLQPTVGSVDSPDAIRIPDAERDLLRLIAPPLRDLMARAAVAAGMEIGAAVPSDSALRYLENYLPRLAQEVSANTRAGLQEAVHAGIAAGEPIGQMQSRVAAALGDETNYRAERIARTEVANVYGRGKLETWKAGGVVKKKWVLAPGACEFCRALVRDHPEPIPIDAAWYTLGDTVAGDEGGVMTISWQPVMAQPLHPNDYCVVVPVVE